MTWAKSPEFVPALKIAGDGLEQFFVQHKKISYSWSAPNGHPWIKLERPTDEIHFIGITLSRGLGPSYLKLRVFLYAAYQPTILRFLEGKKFLFEGVSLPRGKAYPLDSYEKRLAQIGVLVEGYEVTVDIDAWSGLNADTRLQNLLRQFCQFVQAVVDGGAEYDALPSISLPAPVPAWAEDQDAIDSIESRTDLNSSQREALVKLRIGQGHFRDQLVIRWGACSVTGCKMIDYLVASHIFPWSECTTSEQRWCADNGLLLIPCLDKLFDKGVIGFNNDGIVIIRKDAPVVGMQQFGVHPNLRIRQDILKNFNGITNYLAKHRQHHGLGTSPP